jgi:hypothetical protein
MPSLQEFVYSFQKDIARANRFDVYIVIPPGINTTDTNDRTLSLRCEAAQLPGRTFSTTEQRTYGPIEKYPYLTTFTDLDLTFIVDDDMNQKQFFDNWLEFINPLNTNNYKYKTDYVTDILINQYSVTDELTYSARLIEAYPISINQLDLDWNSEGYHKLTVTFAYTRWEKF